MIFHDWLVVSTYPSEFWKVRQLGWWHSQLIWKVIQNSMVPVTTNQICHGHWERYQVAFMLMNSLWNCSRMFRLVGTYCLGNHWIYTRPGKLTENYGKSPFLMGKSTINGTFSIAMLFYQRVCHGKCLLKLGWCLWFHVDIDQLGSLIFHGNCW